MPNLAVEVTALTTEIDGQLIHQGLNLDIMQGEILAIVGGSGAGKTTLLNCLLMLIAPVAGSIKIFGQDVARLTDAEREALRTQCGIMFQGGALFSELTVLENILFPMQQHSTLPEDLLHELALLKMNMAGLISKHAEKYPAELSGGMIKRAAVARSLALDPPILFLDEPSSGLDPVNAGALDQLILELRDSLQLTVVIVTHDLDTLATVPDRIAYLGDGRVLACDTLENLLQSTNPEIKAYFNNPRAKRAFLS